VYNRCFLSVNADDLMSRLQKTQGDGLSDAL
jgi:hypothetical protein